VSDWLELLAGAVAAAGGNKAAVGRELGCSRTAVSLLLSGQYRGRTDRMAARITERYARVDCPHLGQQVPTSRCRTFTGQVPSSSPIALRQWRACRACPHNPETKNAKEAS
jgi:hypothetical protein